MKLSKSLRVKWNGSGKHTFFHKFAGGFWLRIGKLFVEWGKNA